MHFKSNIRTLRAHWSEILRDSECFNAERVGNSCTHLSLLQWFLKFLPSARGHLFSSCELIHCSWSLKPNSSLNYAEELGISIEVQSESLLRVYDRFCFENVWPPYVWIDHLRETATVQCKFRPTVLTTKLILPRNTVLQLEFECIVSFLFYKRLKSVTYRCWTPGLTLWRP